MKLVPLGDRGCIKTVGCRRDNKIRIIISWTV